MACMLATTQSHLLLFGNFEFHGTEFGVLVGTIAKRLILGLPTATPPIGSRLHFKDGRACGRNRWFCHHDLLKAVVSIQ